MSKTVSMPREYLFTPKNISISHRQISTDEQRAQDIVTHSSRQDDYHNIPRYTHQTCVICAIPLSYRAFPNEKNIDVFSVSRNDVSNRPGSLICVDCFGIFFNDLDKFKTIGLNGHFYNYGRKSLLSLPCDDEVQKCLLCDEVQIDDYYGIKHTVSLIDDIFIVRHSDGIIYPKAKYDYETSKYVVAKSVCAPALQELNMWDDTIVA